MPTTARNHAERAAAYPCLDTRAPVRGKDLDLDFTGEDLKHLVAVGMHFPGRRSAGFGPEHAGMPIIESGELTELHLGKSIGNQGRVMGDQIGHAKPRKVDVEANLGPLRMTWTDILES